MKKKTIWITTGALATVLVAGGAGIAIADPFDGDQLSGSSLDEASAAALTEVGSGTVTDSETSDDRDHAYEIEVTKEDGHEVDVTLDDSFAVVGTDDDDDATDGDDGDDDGRGGDQPISESDRSSAEEAAIAETGGGTVTELERSDDLDHAWEVEVTLDDDNDIDVELDADFAVTQVDQ